MAWEQTWKSKETFWIWKLFNTGTQFWSTLFCVWDSLRGFAIPSVETGTESVFCHFLFWQPIRFVPHGHVTWPCSVMVSMHGSQPRNSRFEPHQRKNVKFLFSLFLDILPSIWKAYISFCHYMTFSSFSSNLNMI